LTKVQKPLIILGFHKNFTVFETVSSKAVSTTVLYQEVTFIG